MKMVAAALVCAAVTAALPLAAYAEDVVFPDFRGREEEQVFAYAVLAEALERAPGDYRLVKSSRPEMTNARALVELEDGRVDVVWVGTSRELEERFRPVYIPITRGLLGNRLFVIRADRQQEFSRVESLADLREFTGGQGTGWTDTRILRQAGLEITTASFDVLFQLVDAGRIDYYPLGASEVYGFLEQYRSRYPDITVESDIVLVYRFDFLFFVNRDDAALHDAIRSGMEAMYEDGTYMEMYTSHPELAPYLERADLDSRRRLEIPNPIASEELRAIPDRYWMGSGN
ncbi:MAG: transporter substrate-binding domain-containing protein [Spirochaetes bacterium]|jgi:ABC-type amino acid transport substrate-binding protein|nr:transporter substrate-binding domain-containing protein [Spirochaetota bacterium]